MLILTAGDHRFRDFVAVSRGQALRFGYDFLAYDLGGLDLPDAVQAQKLQAYADQLAGQGFYSEVQAGYFSRALHKPLMVKECLSRCRDFVAYLDGDAFLLDPIDEILSGDYDVGVVRREAGDTTSHPEIAGVVNAGVIFFANTPGCRSFVERWQAETQATGNDQMALNRLLDLGSGHWEKVLGNPPLKRFRRWLRGREPRPEVWEFRPGELPTQKTIGDVRIRIFDSAYNCSLMPLPQTAKVAHFKGDRRSRFAEYQLLAEKLRPRAA